MMVPRLIIYKQKRKFLSLLLYHYVFPTLSNISQNNTKDLEKQWQGIQWRYKEELLLLIQLEKAAKLCQAECAAQKARRKAEAKAREEESCGERKEEEENIGISLTTLGQSTRERSHPSEGY